MGPTRRPPVNVPGWNERAAVALLVLVAGHLLAVEPASARSPPTAWPASSARTRTTSPRSSPPVRGARAIRCATAPSSSAASSVPARPRSTSVSSPASPSPWPTPIFASTSPAPPPRPASTSSRRTRRDGDRRRCRRDVGRLSEEDDMATQVTDGAACVTWPATTGRRPLRREARAGPTIGDDARAMYPPHRASPTVSIAGRGTSYPQATRWSPRASPCWLRPLPAIFLRFCGARAILVARKMR